MDGIFMYKPVFTGHFIGHETKDKATIFTGQVTHSTMVIGFLNRRNRSGFNPSVLT